MIQCAKCGNDTRTSELLTSQGAVMVAGRMGTAPLPVIAQVCTACGYIELYAPHPVDAPAPAAEVSEPAIAEPELAPAVA